MKSRLRFTPKIAATALAGFWLATAPAQAQQCGGDFRQFLAGVKQEALAKGLSANAADQTLAGAQIDRKVLSRDRAQGVFKMTFLDFSKRVISGYRMKNGAANMKKYASVFQRTESESSKCNIPSIWTYDLPRAGATGSTGQISARVDRFLKVGAFLWLVPAHGGFRVCGAFEALPTGDGPWPTMQP